MQTGKVVLVGAGPGDPGLLTLKGRQVLAAADVVVYDRLVCAELLDYAPNAKKIDVGKRQGHHPVPQQEINAILVREGKKGGLVARLKGGDPYLFGRGGEEAAALAENGIPFEVVPGVTSALAAPAYAGIPVTQRGTAGSVHIITGHAHAGETLDLDYDALRRTGGTLVFLMAVASMPAIAAGLLAAGMPAQTPAAVVENGTLPVQRRVDGTLGDIAERATAAAVQSPAILVVGGVCGMAEQLDWFSALPLFGKTVVVTRPKERAGTLCGKLRALGANVVGLPCIESKTRNTGDVRSALGSLQGYSWLALTSPQGVQSLFEVLEQMGLDARALAPVRLAAVGPGTAKELAAHGLRADYMPGQYDATGLAQGLLQKMRPGERLLLLRAQEGTPELPAALGQGGVGFKDVALYETLPVSTVPEGVRELVAKGGAQYVTFTSASTVQGFAACMPGQPAPFTAVCIGHASEAAARAQGYKTIKAQNATIDYLVQAILEDTEHE